MYNVHNLNNVSREASGHFRNKEKGNLKVTIDEREIISKTKNARDLYGAPVTFKRVTSLVKDYRCALLRSLSVFSLGGGTISLSYMALIMLDRNTYRGATSA